jgi:hypothetical protein
MQLAGHSARYHPTPSTVSSRNSGVCCLDLELSDCSAVRVCTLININRHSMQWQRVKLF